MMIMTLQEIKIRGGRYSKNISPRNGNFLSRKNLVYYPTESFLLMGYVFGNKLPYQIKK